MQQAYIIDKKIDDGLPQSGRVQAMYLDGYIANALTWAGTGVSYTPPYTTSTAGSSTTCFDNGSGSGAQQYSTKQNNGSGSNCALSFQMQGAAR